MFQQLLVNKHHRLNDSKSQSRFGRVEVLHLDTNKTTKNPVQNPECTQPMAVRLTIVIRIKWECPLANWLNKISRKLQCNATK